jgi:redox-sensitive bicupin YhaK (pirin superfamily)
MKKLIGINRDADAHWVGNGFPVRTIFSFQSLGQCISPFLLLDYAGPAEFPPSNQPRGVGEHPHRGFETVTIVYQGENGSQTAATADLAIFDRSGDRISVEAAEDATLLALSGEPIDEPVVSHGPFVMNTQEEIRQAIRDYRSGKMGRLSS